MLRPMRTEWEMRFVDSSGAAINCIQSDTFDVIVSDMRMPNMDGAELLKEVTVKHFWAAKNRSKR